MKFFEYIDTQLIAKCNTFSRWLQRWTGLTCYFIAKCGVFITALDIMLCMVNKFARFLLMREPGEKMSALAEIQDRIQSTSALISQYESAIAGYKGQAPASLPANIRSLEKLRNRLERELLCLGTSDIRSTRWTQTERKK